MTRKIILSLTIIALVGVSFAIQAPAPVQAQDTGWCSDVDIVFFPGGPAGGPFAQVVANGAVQAEADLGPHVQYVWSDWDPEPTRAWPHLSWDRRLTMFQPI